jgi:hypothetical protein
MKKFDEIYNENKMLDVKYTTEKNRQIWIDGVLELLDLIDRKVVWKAMAGEVEAKEMGKMRRLITNIRASNK